MSPSFVTSLTLTVLVRRRCRQTLLVQPYRTKLVLAYRSETGSEATKVAMISEEFQKREPSCILQKENYSPQALSSCSMLPATLFMWAVSSLRVVL
jgi:hypothetical protein